MSREHACPRFGVGSADVGWMASEGIFDGKHCQLRCRLLGLRMILVCRPRIDPATLDVPQGVERDVRSRTSTGIYLLLLIEIDPLRGVNARS